MAKVNFKVSKKLYARYEELYEKAVAQYLDKTDWDISEWLEPEEYEEYKKLDEKIFGGE